MQLVILEDYINRNQKNIKKVLPKARATKQSFSFGQNKSEIVENNIENIETANEFSPEETSNENINEFKIEESM